MTRRSPNGATHMSNTHVLPIESNRLEGRTWGSEPSQYPEEKKTTVIPSVAASERGTA